MKYLKLYEGFESANSINWDMVEDIKDMSLEYLDDGCMLGFYVYGVPNRKLIYRFYYSHENGYREEWGKSSNGIVWLHYNNSDKLGQICYVIMLFNKYGVSMMCDPKISNELIDRIKEAYPNEDVRSS